MKQLIILSIIVFSFSCTSNTSEEPDSTENKKENPDGLLVTLTEAQAKNAHLVIGKAEKRNISTLLQVNGKVDVPPQNIVSVSFPLGGYLKTTNLLPGMPVKKGQIIAVLEDPQYIQLQQDYLSAKIRLELLEKDYERHRDLNASQASSDKVFQQAQSDFQTQRVLVKALSQKLSLIGLDPDKVNENNISKSINIFSPINGFVSKVDVNIGRYVSATEVLFELINPQDLHLALSVFQKDVYLLGIGQKVKANTVNNPEKKYGANIILISRDISSDGSVEVHCHFDEYDKNLIPGMYMNAEIATETRNAVAVPEDAVVAYDNKRYIFLAKSNNLYEMNEVQTGINENGFVIISSTNNHSILQQDMVLKNAYNLLMKLRNTGEE